MSLCLDDRSYHSMRKEAVLFLLPAQTTEIIRDQDCVWIKVLLHNLNSEWLWAQADFAVS